MSRPSSPVDLLRWPVLGRLLRWRHARTALQTCPLALALVVVLHGLLGPQLASRNLATVLVWVHYRGLLVVALLVAGNLTCAGCPFVLVRDLGRRVRRPARRWPAALRGKWPAIALFGAVLFFYEWLDLWASPRGTAWLLLAYFAAALLVDTTFSGASFCKHMCPIGQYNFMGSTLSPLEVRVRQPATCGTCRTEDCIRGVREPGRTRVGQRGCELGLFLPRKIGNLDCTLCLDCVQACPHDNVALALRVPGAELADGRRRSGIGSPSRRPDLAALAVVFTFGAVLNAFGMVSPVYALEQWMATASGVRSEGPILGAIFAAALVVAPLVLLGVAALATRMLAAQGHGVGSLAVAYAPALVPLGFGVWLAHYGFHLLTGVLTVVPVAQSAVADVLGRPALGAPLWSWAGLPPQSLYPLQMGFVLLGSMGSIATVYGISQRVCAPRPSRASLPWVALLLLLASVALWVLAQPMEMRGTSL